MKKNYFMLAAATMMLAACAKTDLVNEVNTVVEPQAIGFETFAQKATRATENSTASYSWDLEDHHTTFSVWGYKDVQTSYIFNNKKVSHSNEIWSYTGLVYWDKAATAYEFYAAAPADIADENPQWVLNENVDNTQNDDFFTIGSIDNTGEGNNVYYTVTAHNAAAADAHSYKESFKGITNAEDLMIAEPKNVQNENFGESVQLNFTHILSRLNVTVSKDESLKSATVTLNSLTFHNINNKGAFNESAVINNLTSGTTVRWTLSNETTSYAALTNETLLYVSSAETTPAGATKNPEYMLQALIMPQTAGQETITLAQNDFSSINEPYFTINYTILEDGNSETFTASYNLAKAFNITTVNETLAFNEGWQNTLNITISPTAIEFDANVAEWAGTPISQEIN